MYIFIWCEWQQQVSAINKHLIDTFVFDVAVPSRHMTTLKFFCSQSSREEWLMLVSLAAFSPDLLLTTMTSSLAHPISSGYANDP